VNISLTKKHLKFSGSAGTLQTTADDHLALRMAMLIEGETELGATAAAQKYRLSRQRYYQLIDAFEAHGSVGLRLQTPGPKGPSKRTDSLQRLVIRYRFLDPEASSHVICQKLRQQDHWVSIRTVERTIAQFGLQKKTLRA
jgi:transposase